ncbi:MAG: hypothetical protein WAM14_22110 [Candidatus Nitrosopolaris sp.]
MAKVMLEGYKCERCGHTWIPRATTKQLPTICPRCKSPYWNRPRIGNKISDRKINQPIIKSEKIKNGSR